MNKPQFLINSYLDNCKGDCDQLCKDLFEQGVLSKQYNEDGLILIYHKFDDYVITDLKRECRSLVIDKATLKIKAYSCEEPILNVEKENIPTTSIKYIHKCYEGTLLSVFNHNQKWYVSTRRCLNSNLSTFTTSDLNMPKSHYKMFEEVLLKAGYSDFDNFCSCLDVTKSYYFVLIHHENKHIIDYSYKFDSHYMCLYLISIKDSEMVELDIYEDSLPFISKYIFLPEQLESIDDFTSLNNKNSYASSLQDEGIIVKVFSPETLKCALYKLQTDKYRFEMIVGNDRNMFKGLIHLYQTNKLIDYFNQNPYSNLVKIVNPINIDESYFTVGVIDSAFKVCTSELLELLKITFSLKTGKSQNKELYDLLPKEYKTMLYAIRGLYYKKKAILFLNTKEKTTDEFRNSHISINDIYNYLKKLPVDVFIDFLRIRKLMFNLVNFDRTNTILIQFGKISMLCNKVQLKQCAIFTSVLHPKITKSDFPNTKA